MLPFFAFRHCLTLFSLESFAPFIRNETNYAMMVVVLLKCLRMIIENTQKKSAIFVNFGGAPSYARSRLESTASSSHLFDWCVSLLNVGGTQCVWEEWL